MLHNPSLQKSCALVCLVISGHGSMGQIIGILFFQLCRRSLLLVCCAAFYSFSVKKENLQKVQLARDPRVVKQLNQMSHCECSILPVILICPLKKLFRFETVDMTLRLLVPIIVLQNHNRYNILQAGHNNSIDVQAIEKEVS
jgi:hypothetical protein